MAKVWIALLALLFYSGFTQVSRSLVVIVVIALIVGFLLIVTLGLTIRHRVADQAAIMIGAWTPMLAVVAAAGSAALAFLTEWIAYGEPQDAPPVESAGFALGAALVAALLELWKEPVEKFSPGWLTKKILCGSYERLFPAQPASPTEGIKAYRTVRDACRGASELDIDGRKDLFVAVATAIEAGAFEGGEAWVPVDPPR